MGVKLSRLEALFAEWAELGVDGWTGVGNQVLRLRKRSLKNHINLKQKTHLVVEAGEGLRVEEAVVPAVVDPRVVRHAHNVR